jgi:phospholipase/lecithinase/hemolysin
MIPRKPVQVAGEAQMKIFRHWLAAGLLSALGATAAGAASFSQLVVFGDSLSDAGNAYALTGGNFPPSPPYAVTFSNGPTAAQYLASQFGVPVQLGWPAASPGSNNFAVGGARNGTGNYNVEVDRPPGLGAAYPAMAQTGIQRQVERYAAQNPAVPAPASTLFMVWGGPNDMFLGLETLPPADLPAHIQGAVTDLASDIAALAALGARHILVPGLPDLGKTPEGLSLGLDISTAMSLASAGYNAGLDAALDFLAGQLTPLGVNLYEFDTAGFLDEVANDPSFGFTNITQSCLYDGGLAAVANGCAGYLYFDNVHPTTAAHRLLAGQFAAAVPEPGTLALVAIALWPAAYLARRRRLPQSA